MSNKAPDMAAIARILELAENVKPKLVDKQNGLYKESTAEQLVEFLSAAPEMAYQLRRLVAVCEGQRKLLTECSHTLAMWADVAPAVSLRADIDKALALTREPAT